MADSIASYAPLQRVAPPSGRTHARKLPAWRDSLASIRCASCRVRGQCLPADMDDSECASFEQLLVRRRLLSRGEALRQMNEPVHDRLHVVHSGQLKCYQVSHAGEQRVTALPAAGDLLGLDTIGMRSHTTAASANCPSIICEFNYATLLAAMRRCDPLARRLELLLSKDLARQQAINLMLTSPRAEQKLAIFLLRAAWVDVQLGGDGVTVEPQVSRRDIADYLGLTDATIARLLRRLIRAGCISVSRRRFTLLAPGRLRDIARGDDSATSSRLAQVAD